MRIEDNQEMLEIELRIRGNNQPESIQAKKEKKRKEEEYWLIRIL